MFKNKNNHLFNDVHNQILNDQQYQNDCLIMIDRIKKSLNDIN